MFQRRIRPTELFFTHTYLLAYLLIHVLYTVFSVSDLFACA